MPPFFPLAHAQDSPPSLPGSKDNSLPNSPLGDSAFSLPDDDDIFSTNNESGDIEFDKSEEELQEAARREAFDAALQGLLPLRPQEIRELLEHFDRTQESVQIPVHPYPKPEMTVQTVSLDPGTKPLTVMVAHGHVTTINFVDATGAPWPVENITWAGNFEVVETDTGGGSGGGGGGSDDGESNEPPQFSNIIRISPESEFAYGNMSIMMTGLRTPIIMTLETSRDIVHYRFDAIIPENGPFAKIPIIGRGGAVGIGNPFVNQGVQIQAGDEDITTVLEGVPPVGAEKLVVSGVDRRTSAYRFNGLTYIRTPHTLLSPGWNASATSADGMHVYSIEDAPVVILSDNGRTVRARLIDQGDVAYE